MPSFYSVAPFIQANYPEYYSIEAYPANACICIRKVKEEWGLLGNFSRPAAGIQLNGLNFRSTEQLFQVMKFTHADALKAVYQANNPKMTAKHWEKEFRRSDWGNILVDALKCCLQLKYDQCPEFRELLERSRGKWIVEDQTNFRKKQADTWGAKLQGDHYIGPNLQGRLLMELREKGQLNYLLPPDFFQFTKTLLQML